MKYKAALTLSLGRGGRNRFSSWGGMSVQIYGPAGNVPRRTPVPVPLGTAPVVPSQPCQQVTAVLAEQGWGDVRPRGVEKRHGPAFTSS